MLIPDELVSLVREHRMIPFVGAGFSAGLGLPNWEDLLRDVCSGTEGAVDFERLLEDTNGDLLQVAEYLYLKHDRQIGPIRHAVTKGLGGESEPVMSGVHVELVNLGAQQIYTTNYDDLIEETFRALSLPVMSVVLPKDVALADNKKTQVVKYHGDLRHENTLVLTESAYYKRLDFESPMDLKFRSDLLGKSVLFMGYSFRDINIRIIWFKLMEMMKDIPESDRTPSYIVRAQPNEPLEDLYRAVGLRPIVLSDSTKELTADERTRLHAEFLVELVDKAGVSPMAMRRRGAFTSAARIDALDARIERLSKADIVRSRSRFAVPLQLIFPNRQLMTLSRIPDPLRGRAEEVYSRLLTKRILPLEHWEVPLHMLETFGASDAVTSFFVDLVASGGLQDLRNEVLEDERVDWSKVWDGRLTPDQVEAVLDRFKVEIDVHRFEEPDADLAYVVDVVKRALSGELIDRRRMGSFKTRAEELLGDAAALYPTVAMYVPEQSSKPDPRDILAEIDTARKGKGRTPRRDRARSR